MRRILRFGTVGSLCLLLQILLLHGLRHVLPPAGANALAFVISAQVNFVLSYRFTWQDSDRKTGRMLGAVWLKYNGLVLVSAGVNTAAFVLFRSFLPGPDAAAVLFASMISTTGTFLVNHLIIFRPKGTSHELPSWNYAVPPGAQ